MNAIPLEAIKTITVEDLMKIAAQKNNNSSIIIECRDLCQNCLS